MKRIRTMEITFLTLTLISTFSLFVGFSQFSTWMAPYIILMKPTVDIGRANFADISVRIPSLSVLTVSRDLENISARIPSLPVLTVSRDLENISARILSLPVLTVSRDLENISNTETMKAKGVDTVNNEVKDGCTFPLIDPFDPKIMAHSKSQPPISCNSGVPHLVYVNGNIIQVDHSKTALFRYKKNMFKQCIYTTLERQPGSDFQTVVLYTSPPFKDSITLRDSDDNVVVECYNRNNKVISRSYFSLVRVKHDLELLLEENFKKHMTLNNPKEVLNVLMIGIDGNSKQNFQRHMPKTRDFLLKDLNAIELHKYNKEGENTFPNVVPLLTGKPSTYLHRNNWTFNDHLDYVNDDFLWSDYHKAGYRTGLFVDCLNRSAFHFLKQGWNKPPVDYYFRIPAIELDHDKLMKPESLPHCVGDVPEITFNHGFWFQMASTFNNSQTKPFFGYSFSIFLTHDEAHMASAGDHLYMRFLQELRDKNVTNNTVIVFFSDHGARFGEVRKTYNGMIEARTPYMFLVFPPWFHQKYPDLMKVLKINQERLTTNTDVYETLQDLLNFQAETRLGDINKKGISLFQEIPRERTCEHAGISIEFCVCNHLSQTNVSSSTTMALAVAVHDAVNTLISKIQDKCEKLSTNSVQNVMEVHLDSPAQNKSEEAKSVYQITLTTTPGDALYEATVIIFNNTKKIEVMGEITRLNMYRGQADCINDLLLKPYCFCKK